MCGVIGVDDVGIGGKGLGPVDSKKARRRIFRVKQSTEYQLGKECRER